MKHIAISGTVGAGKTTLLNRLTEALGSRACFHVEQPDVNPFIRLYYADSRRWSFHSQVAFLSAYAEDDARCADYYFYDRCLIENLVICRYRLQQGDLTEDEYAVLSRLAHGIEHLMPKIDGYIYLSASEELLCRRLRDRGRDYEQQLDMSYVRPLKKLYDEWAQALPKERTLILNADEGYDINDILRFMEAL